ncbi:MAG: hypothetical protein AAF674_20580 [Pseudomonadota bacterium]
MNTLNFRQKDVERTIRAVVGAGQSVRLVDLSRGGLIRIHVNGTAEHQDPHETNDWDEQ